MPHFRKKRFNNRKANLPRLIRSVVLRQSETKFKTFEAAAYTDVGTAGTLTDITILSQGSTASTRIGDRITATKVFVQKIFRLEDAAASQSSVRIMVVQSKGAVLTAGAFPAFCEAGDTDQYFIIKDIMIPMSHTTRAIAVGDPTMYTGSMPTMVKWKIKKIPKSIIYYDGVLTAPKGHGIYLWMVAETATVQQCGFEQLYYKDL